MSNVKLAAAYQKDRQGGGMGYSLNAEVVAETSGGHVMRLYPSMGGTTAPLMPED